MSMMNEISLLYNDIIGLEATPSRAFVGKRLTAMTCAVCRIMFIVVLGTLHKGQVATERQRHENCV